MPFPPQGLTKYLPAYLRSHPTAAVVLGVGVAGVLWLTFAAPASPPIARAPKEPKVVQAAVTPEQTLQFQVGELTKHVNEQAETITRFTKLMQQMERTMAEQAQTRTKDQGEWQARLTTLQQQHERELARLRQAQSQTHTPRVVKADPKPEPPPVPPTPTFQLRTVGSSKDSARPTLPPLVHHTTTAYLPTGCFAPVRLVTGTAATSDMGNNGFGHPILFSITEPFECARRLDAMGRPALRQRTGMPLDGCLGFAHGKGDIANSRVQGQATVLSCVMPDDEAYETPIKGYLVGSDGDQGLHCTVETHESAKVGKAFLAGLIQEAAAFFRTARKGITITAVGQTSPYGGMESTLNNVANFWLQQARSLAPTCHAPSGSRGYLILQEGVPVEGLSVVNFLRTGGL